MTDAEINIAIAECCGWTGYCDRCSNGIVEHFDGEGNYSGSSGCEFCQGNPIPIPSYCTDLNDMLQVESGANKKERDAIADWLDDGNGGHFATARQRAEAFLRVKGLWKE